MLQLQHPFVMSSDEGLGYWIPRIPPESPHNLLTGSRDLPHCQRTANYQQIAHSCRGFRQLAPSTEHQISLFSGCMFLVTNVLPQVRGLWPKRHGACSPRLRSVQNPSLQGLRFQHTDSKGRPRRFAISLKPPATRRLGILENPLDSNGG